MCGRLITIKFNSDEKRLTRLFISVFVSECILCPTKSGRPLWCGPCGALRAGFGMIINLPVILCQWQNTIVTTNNYTILFGLLSRHRFQVIECDVYV